MTKFSDDDFRAEARVQHEQEGLVEIDGEAIVSRADEDEPIYGAYVQAWVWVEFDEDDEAADCADNMSHPNDSCPAEGGG